MKKKQILFTVFLLFVFSFQGTSFAASEKDEPLLKSKSGTISGFSYDISHLDKNNSEACITNGTDTINLKINKEDLPNISISVNGGEYTTINIFNFSDWSQKVSIEANEFLCIVYWIVAIFIVPWPIGIVMILLAGQIGCGIF